MLTFKELSPGYRLRSPLGPETFILVICHSLRNLKYFFFYVFVKLVTDFVRRSGTSIIDNGQSLTNNSVSTLLWTYILQIIRDPFLCVCNLVIPRPSHHSLIWIYPELTILTRRFSQSSDTIWLFTGGFPKFTIRDHGYLERNSLFSLKRLH